MSDDQWPIGTWCWAWNDRANQGQRALIVDERAGRFTLQWADGRITSGHFRSSLHDQNRWAARTQQEEPKP